MYYVILILDLLLLLEIWNGGQTDLPPLKKLLSKSSALLGLKVIYEQQKEPSYWEKIFLEKFQKFLEYVKKSEGKLKSKLCTKEHELQMWEIWKQRYSELPDILHYKAQVKIPIIKKGNICIFKKDFLS